MKPKNPFLSLSRSRFWLRCALYGAVGLLIMAVAGNTSVQAQPARQWSVDQKVPGYLDDTFTPYLLADQNQTVHAFTSQLIDDGGRRQAIVYRRWSLAGGWTRPVDVILAPAGNAVFLGAFLDQAGQMHVIFANGEGRNAAVYYASAPAQIADSVYSWSVPKVIATGISGVNSAALSGDGRGNLVVIYSGNIDGSGVYAVRSLDGGETWSEPLPVYLTQNTELTPYSLRLFANPEGFVRAAWNVVTNLGVDELLYFASYDLARSEWTQPIQLDRRIDIEDYFGPSFPAIVDNGREIVVFYNGGNPFAGLPVLPGRPVQRATVSRNGGETWSDPVVPFPFHVGRSGEHAMTLDGAGNAHVLFVQRIEKEVDGKYSIIGGIWHSVFQNGSWSSPDRFVTTYSPHDVRSIVVQGNVLLVVWREDPGEGQHGVWYSYTVLDVPPLPVVPLPTANPASLLTANLFGPPTATPVGGGTPPAAQPTPTPRLTDREREILNENRNPAMPFVAGLIPVVAVLLVVLVLYGAVRRR